MAVQPYDAIQKELLDKLEEIEEDEKIDLLTEEGRELYAVRMSEIQAGLELMQRVLLKHGLEGGFIEETTRILEQIEEMEPTEGMCMVPSWFVDVRTGNPAVFIFPTNPSDALGEATTEDVYTPNGLWFAKASVYHISAILARVFPLPNYKKGEVVPTPVWQVYDCVWVARLNAQALHLYHFDEGAPWGRKAPKTEALPEPEEPARAEPLVCEGCGKKFDTKKKVEIHEKKCKKALKKVKDAALDVAIDKGETVSPKTLKQALDDKYTPEKYFEDIKVTVDQFKCNEVFFLLQTLQVRYVAVFSQLVRRIYGEQLLREMTIAAALEEYLNMRKGFGESVTESWLGKLSDKVIIIFVIGVFALAAMFVWLAFTSGEQNVATGIIQSGSIILGSLMSRVKGLFGR